MCTPAPTLVAAVKEANAKWPGVEKSLGICAARSTPSEHPEGNALDLRHAPEDGLDIAVVGAALVARRDPRVKYVIFNRRIYGPESRYGWEGGPYTGKDPHTGHLHLSIIEGARNDMTPWWGGSKNDDFGGGGTAPTTDGPTDPMSGFTPTSIIPGADQLAALGKAFTFITDGGNWVRVGMFFGGSVVIVVGILLWVASQKAVQGLVSNVTSEATFGAVDTGRIAGEGVTGSAAAHD